MNYLEYNFTSADEQTAEILMALLSEKGFDTFEQNANQLSAYIEENKNVISEMDVYLADLQQKFIFTWSQKKFEGICSPFEAYLLNNGLKTLALRMDRHCSNALKLAQYLETHAIDKESMRRILFC